jgi:hypothetical protein
MSEFIQKKAWSDDELKKRGFQRFRRKKTLVMARVLLPEEAPLQIHTRWGETLYAKAGYIICYTPGETVQASLSRYDHWPVEFSIFTKTYQKWDPILQTTPAINDLIAQGCKPFYKVAGVWAKELEQDVYVQSQESKQPVLVEKERILAIGVEGEPYHMGAETFADRYDTQAEQEKPKIKSVLKRLISFFKSDSK